MMVMLGNLRYDQEIRTEIWNTYQIGFILKCIMQIGDPSSIAINEYIAFLPKASCFRTLN